MSHVKRLPFLPVVVALTIVGCARSPEEPSLGTACVHPMYEMAGEI